MQPAEAESPRESHVVRTVCHSWGLMVLLILALALSCFTLVYLWWEPFTRSGASAIDGLDDTGYYVWARSLIIDGDLDFENDFAEAPTTSREAVAVLATVVPRTANGRINNKWPPGWSMATVPWVALGHIAAKATHQPTDGWSLPYQIAVWLGHLAYSAAGAWCAFRWLRYHVGSRSALLAFLVLWIASPLIYYQTCRVSMPHGLIFNLTALTWLLAARIHNREERALEWMLLGGAAGLMLCTRLSTAGLLLYPAWMVARRLICGRRDWARLALGVGAGALVLGIGLVARRVADGSWWTEPYAGERLNYFDPAWWNVFFSPKHGLFYWHPLLLLGALGLGWGIVARRFPGSLIVACLSVSWINAAWWCWWFGSSYGNRAFDGCILAAMLGLAYLWDRLNTWGRRGLAALLTIGLMHGTVLLVCFVVHVIPRSEPVTYRELCRAFLALSGLASLP